MDTFEPGDRIRVLDIESSEAASEFIVCSALSDREEGLGPEISDYVACWLEVSRDDCTALANRRTISLGTDFRYSMDGRYVKIEKIKSRDKVDELPR